jgi:ceramide glucosyltransferase
MVRELADPRVGLVTSAFTGVGGESPDDGLGETLGAIFDNLHLGTFVAGSMAAARRVGHPLVVGKSMLFRRGDLEALGGWTAVRNLLAEDYVLGRRFAAAGHRVALARQALTVIHRRRPLRGFFGRHLRWSQMRRRISLASYLGEPLLNPTPWLLGTLAAALRGLSAGPVTAPALALLAAAGLGLKVALDGAQLRRLSGLRPPLRHLVWVPVKDLSIFALWTVGLFRRELDWRGNRLRVGAGSELDASRHETSVWVE